MSAELKHLQTRKPEIVDPTAGCGPIRSASSAPLRQQVFECIRSAGQIPRVEVAKALGISAGSVTTLSSELIREGFVQEGPLASAAPSRGRPPVALSVRPGRGHVVGIKLAESVHTAVLADFAGTPLSEARLTTDPSARSLSAMLDAAQALFSAVAAEAGVAPGSVAAVGIGLPGIVDHDAGTWVWSPLLPDRDMPLRDMAAQRFGCPVQIDNDVNVLTLAELWYGAGRAQQDFAVVTIEHGVGMGLVIGERLYRGANGFGMELGHTKVQLDGALCRCGQRGCLEAYVADYAIVREATTALGLHGSELGSTHMLMESLYDQAKAGNEAARTIFRRAGRYLSLGLANVMTLFDPSLIILSGDRMRYDYLYAGDTLGRMKAMIINNAHRPIRVEVHAWGDWVWARGAATLALSHLTDALLSGEAA
ncbi:ROK family transcriptional regulator [Halovulum marinum]|uniref:ROK family transcriptional regulator n=1 Tax=Halovulum marinum TaxID=2662447 RepID=UPI001F20D43A|nr:ROK family transcriptional regulator [Halovulum marinum]